MMRAISYSPTNETAGHIVELWRDEAGKLRRLRLDLQEHVVRMRFAAGSGNLITVTHDREIRTWRTVDAMLERSVSAPETCDLVVLASILNERTALFADRRGFCVLFDLITQGVTRTAVPFGRVIFLARDATGERFATVTADSWCRVWSTHTGEPLSPPMRNGGALTWVDWSPDGKRIAMAGLTPEVRVWDASTGDLSLPPLRLGNQPLRTATWSLDGRFIVARSDDNTTRVWDAATGEAVTPLLKHTGRIHLAQLVANNRLITLSDPNLLRAWDLNETSLSQDILADYARLLSGRRLTAAGVMLPVKPHELAELCRSLRARAPQLFAP